MEGEGEGEQTIGKLIKVSDTARQNGGLEEGRKVGKGREQEEEHLCSAKEAQPDNAYREQFGTTARAGIATRPSASLLGRKEGRAQQCVLSPSRATACLEPYLLYSGIGIERAAECCK